MLTRRIITAEEIIQLAKEAKSSNVPPEEFKIYLDLKRKQTRWVDVDLKLACSPCSHIQCAFKSTDKGYSLMAIGIGLPNAIIQSVGILDAHDKLAYMQLCYFDQMQETATLEGLAQQMGHCSRHRVVKSLDNLAEHGLIRYSVADDAEMVEFVMMPIPMKFKKE